MHLHRYLADDVQGDAGDAYYAQARHEKTQGRVGRRAQQSTGCETVGGQATFECHMYVT